MKNILIIILLIAFLPLFGQEQKAATEQAVPTVEKVAHPVGDMNEPTERYYSSDGKYSIAFPPGWELAADLDPGAIAGISAREDQFDFFRENVLVGSFELATTNNLEDYFKGNLEYLKQQIEDLTVESEERIQLDGQPAIKLVYASTISGTRVKTIQIFMIKEGRGYILTAMAMEPSFDQFKAVFEQIISSFRFE